MSGKKGFLFLGLFLLFTVAFFNACNDTPLQTQKTTNESKPLIINDKSTWLDAGPHKAFTIGNRSYITLNSCDDSRSYYSLFDKSGVYPPHYIIIAFEALVAFEKAHPELKVIRWDMEINRPNRLSDLSCLRGIIIDHEPQ